MPKLKPAMPDALTALELEDLAGWDAEAALASAEAAPTTTSVVVAELERALPPVVDAVITLALTDENGRTRLMAAQELIRLALALNVISGAQRDLEAFLGSVRG